MEKRLTLTNDLSQLAQLPLFVDQLREELSLDEEKCFNLNLVLEEAATNVISYAFTDDQVHCFTIDAKTEENLLYLTLTDDGAPFDPTEVPPVDTTAPAEERQIGGLGVFLITQLMAEVKYERKNEQNIFTLITKIHNL